MSEADLVLRIAVTGILIAAAIKSLVKGGMATGVGGRNIWLRIGIPLLGGVPSAAWYQSGYGAGERRCIPSQLFRVWVNQKRGNRVIIKAQSLCLNISGN